MRRLAPSLIFFVAGGLALGSAQLYAQPQDEDEAGLWMVMDQHEQYIRTSQRLIDHPLLQSKIDSIACTLRGDICDQMRIYLVRVPGLNASMAPNGAMIVQSGLLLRVKSEDELAAVIGHEISHYGRRHSVENLRRVRRASAGLSIANALIAAASNVSISTATDYQSLSNALDLSNTAYVMLEAAQVLSVFQLLAFNRNQESEADLDGAEWMYESHYDPRAAVDLWNTVHLENDAGGNEAGFSLMSTHPTPQQRIRDLDSLITSRFPSPVVQEQSDILALINPLRSDWLNDELHALSPEQFQHLVRTQAQFGMESGYISYLEGLSWIRETERPDQSRRRTRESNEAASAAFENGHNSESGFPGEAYREWARVLLALENPARAKWAFTQYLEHVPDAWDARFIRREIESL